MKKIILILTIMVTLIFSTVYGKTLQINNIINTSLGKKITVALTKYESTFIKIKVFNGDATMRLDDKFVTLKKGEKISFFIQNGKLYYNGNLYQNIDIMVTNVTTLIGLSGNKNNYNKYRGNFHFIDQNGLILPINSITTEEYLYSVVPAEMGYNFPKAALKAQAIAARTYLYYNISHSKYVSYDITDSTNSQMYLGYDKENAKINKLINETSNEVILYEGKPIQAFYCSDSGGVTVNPKYVWGKALPYLKSVNDRDNEKYSPKKNWTYKISLNNLSQLFYFNVKNIKVVKYADKRALKILIIGTYEKMLTGQQFRKKIGYTNLFSTFFKIEKKGNNIVFYGHGYGHGVGMSQWGAYAMAKRGKNYKEILHHYYFNVKIEKIKNWQNI